MNFLSFTNLGPLSDLKIKTSDGGILEFSKYMFAMEFEYYETLFISNFKDCQVDTIEVPLCTAVMKLILKDIIEPRCYPQPHHYQYMYQIYQFLDEKLSRRLKNHYALTLNSPRNIILYPETLRLIMTDTLYYELSNVRTRILDHIHNNRCIDEIIHEGMDINLIPVYYKNKMLLISAFVKCLELNNWEQHDIRFALETILQTTEFTYAMSDDIITIMSHCKNHKLTYKVYKRLPPEA